MRNSWNLEIIVFRKDRSCQTMTRLIFFHRKFQFTCPFLCREVFLIYSMRDPFAKTKATTHLGSRRFGKAVGGALCWQGISPYHDICDYTLPKIQAAFFDQRRFLKALMMSLFRFTPLLCRSGVLVLMHVHLSLFHGVVLLHPVRRYR